jgi:hypothetical protein
VHTVPATLRVGTLRCAVKRALEERRGPSVDAPPTVGKPLAPVSYLDTAAAAAAAATVINAVGDSRLLCCCCSESLLLVRLLRTTLLLLLSSVKLMRSRLIFTGTPATPPSCSLSRAVMNVTLPPLVLDLLSFAAAAFNSVLPLAPLLESLRECTGELRLDAGDPLAGDPGADGAGVLLFVIVSWQQFKCIV